MRHLTTSKYIDPKANTYSLVEFRPKHGTEESCKQTLFQLKWPEGFKCPKCGFCHCPHFLKMQFIADAKGSTLLAFSKDNITEGSTIHSDAFKSYNALSGDYCNDMQKYDQKAVTDGQNGSLW